VWLDLQVGNKCGQEFRVLPVHLHVVNFGVEADGVKECLEGVGIEEELIPAEAALIQTYSTHSR
jgi:hypothetical protein